MTAHLSWESMNDLADHTLSATDHADALAHLAECRECESQVRELRELLTAVHNAPSDMTPPADAWAAIQHTINAGKSVPFPAAVVHEKGIRFSRTQLAAAALFLVAATATVTSTVLRQPGLGGFTSDTVGLALSPAVSATSTTATAGEIVMLEAEYLTTALALRATLDQSRSTLAPTTIATVERNLKIIDDAIAEARAALVADPASTALREMLRKSHQQKIDFLRRTTILLEQA